MKITPDSRAKQKFDRNSVCDCCFRPTPDCLCSKIHAIETRFKVVILQHPQEQLKVLNSARLAHLLLRNSRIFVGLSWPNFKKVAGPEENPSAWGVLYLKPDEGEKGGASAAPLTVFNRKKQPVGDCGFLRGIIALDGTWKQSKALWWRNAWLLKLNRISLNPGHPSLRPQVKSEGLSTIEAISLALDHLGERREVGEALNRYYNELIIRGPVISPESSPAPS
jgi:DTW domain-containing protein YfiP